MFAFDLTTLGMLFVLALAFVFAAAAFIVPVVPVVRVLRPVRVVVQKTPTRVRRR